MERPRDISRTFGAVKNQAAKHVKIQMERPTFGQRRKSAASPHGDWCRSWLKSDLRGTPAARCAINVANAMSKALKPSYARMGGVVFELDRFELSARSGCLLEGRWFGVRGRRFMRPTLTLMGDGRATRLLADLTHKPWGPEEGQPWEAVFPGELGDGEPARAELTVAPDITIALPVPDGAAGTAKKRAGGGMETLSREIAETQREIRQSKRALEAAQAETLRNATQRDALVAELEVLRRAREQTEQELDQTAAERDAALQAHKAAIEAGNAARSALERGLAERDAAVAARETAMAERDTTLAARDQAVAERDASTAAWGTAESERDAD